MPKLQEPEGIAFFSIKTGETMHARLEPTIAAFINSSDMGINASRGQDYGWRLDPEWVKKIRAFRADEDAMDRLAAKLRLEDGQSPSTTQILYYIYGRQVRAYLQRLQEEEAPFEQSYQEAISTNPRQETPVPEQPLPTHLQNIADDEPITEDVSEEDLMPDDDDENEPPSAPVEHTAQDEPTAPASENNSTQSRSSRQRNKRNTN